MSEEMVTMEAYSYRVSARFGSRVQVHIKEGQVSIIGPRLSSGVYRTWIGIQAVLLVLLGASLLVALVSWNGWYLLGALVLFIAHLSVGGFGAGCLWEMANLVAFGEGKTGETVTFLVSEVEDVQIGGGWARRGMWLLLLPCFKGIDSLVKDLAVSLLAPDGTPDGGVYALHMRTPEEAQALAKLLKRRE